MGNSTSLERMKTAENERDQARADVQKVTDEAEAERARHNALVAQMAHKAADLEAKLQASQAAASAASAEAERLREEAQQAAADRMAALEQQVADLEADLTTCKAAAIVARSEAQQRLQEAQQAAANRKAALEQVAWLEAELAASEQAQDARTQTPSSKGFSVWSDDEEIEQLTPMHAAASEIVVYRLGEWPVPMNGGITAYNQFTHNFRPLVRTFATLLYGEGNVEGHIAQTQRMLWRAIVKQYAMDIEQFRPSPGGKYKKWKNAEGKRHDIYKTALKNQLSGELPAHLRAFQKLMDDLAKRAKQFSEESGAKSKHAKQGHL